MNGQFKGIKVLIGMSLLAALVWTSAALGSVFTTGSAAAPPANDSFATPFVLTGLTDSRLGNTNVDATLEAGEDPNIAERPASHTIWYSWTPAQRGQVTIDTTTSDFDTLLGVYTGTAVSALTEVANNDDNGGDKTSSVTFNVTAATTYRIRVDGFEGAMGTVNVHVNEILPPVNDDFSNAIVISGATVTRTADTTVASILEPGEEPSVSGSAGGASVWYRWTPAASGAVKIDTAGSGFDTLLGVYTGGAVNALTGFASDDDAPPNLTSAVTVNVTSGTTYAIRVDGFGGLGGTINLHVAPAAPGPTVPGAATGVTATTGAGQATVSWTAPADDGGSALTGYEVTPYAGGVPQASTTVAGTSATISGLVNGTNYTFRVAARNTVGTGAQTNSNAVTPRTVPNAPTGVTATAGAGQATVSWAAPAFNGGSAITGYEVTRYLGGVFQGTTSVGVVTQTTVGGLANGATWTFKVAAVNAAGTGALSAESNSVTPMTVPDAPTGVSATAAAGQATVSWTAPAFGGGATITGYEVTSYVGGVAQGTTTVGVVTQTTLTGLVNGTAYTFRVAAKNGAGTGARSAESNAVVPRTVPGAPTGVAATAATGQATVTWTPPASDGGDAIVSYEVTSYAGGAAQSTTLVAGTQATVAGLTNGTTYTFRVAAKNGVGTGAQSADSNAVTPVAPAAQRFTLTVSKSGTGVGLVTSSAGGITCGTSCAADFDAGTSLTLTAVPAGGSTFSGWSGACTGAGPCLVTIDAVKTVTAAFTVQASQPTQPKVLCVVPKLTLRTLAAAKKKIAAAHCRTGTVTRAKSKTVQKGRVISQRPKAGRKLARGSKVNLVLSRGKR